MAWTPIVDDANGEITYFVEIMRQMDAGYEGLTADNIAELLKKQTAGPQAAPVYYAFYNDAPTEIVLLLRTRDNRHPEVVMLGWLPADPLNVQPDELTTAVRSVIGQVISWAGQLPHPKTAVRAVCPKRMGYSAIHKLHVKLKEAVDPQVNPFGAAAMLRQVDLGDSCLWYIKKN
jgi:hypothetical protein